MVNLKQAIDLYRLVGPHLPDKPVSGVYEFASIIIDSMIKTGQQVNYVDSIRIMTGFDTQTLAEKSTEELNYLFIQGLFENEVFALRDFVRTFLNAA